MKPHETEIPVFRLSDEDLLRIDEANFEDNWNGIVVIDADSVILRANKKVVYFFGYSRPELIGQNVAMLVPQLRREAHGEHVRRWFAHPVSRPMGINMEISGQHKDGSLVPLDLALMHVELGNRLVATGTFSERRVEDRKPAQ